MAGLVGIHGWGRLYGESSSASRLGQEHVPQKLPCRARGVH